MAMPRPASILMLSRFWISQPAPVSRRSMLARARSSGRPPVGAFMGRGAKHRIAHVGMGPGTPPRLSELRSDAQGGALCHWGQCVPAAGDGGAAGRADPRRVQFIADDAEAAALDEEAPARRAPGV